MCVHAVYICILWVYIMPEMHWTIIHSLLLGFSTNVPAQQCCEVGMNIIFGVPSCVLQHLLIGNYVSSNYSPFSV